MPNWHFHVQLVSLFGVNSLRVSLEVSVTGQDNASPRYRIGGAVWCNEHERYECVKDRKQARGGGRCHQPAVTGLDRCRGHAGVTIEVAEAQGAAMDAWTATYGKPAVDSAHAVIGMLNLSVSA